MLMKLRNTPCKAAAAFPCSFFGAASALPSHSTNSKKVCRGTGFAGLDCLPFVTATALSTSSPSILHPPLPSTQQPGA
eukprot:CAMPEP_0172002000 /NCGR_PEP_ID=MMETSP1041-20130122/3176_1 /TAXON_ID=464988 /ORGANISM="Hemiselmis andersenii, Strain CCMP439" /LENGTH=77 /DNA_ID=CAMNT_0012655691 /DNA_START=470 /DNA_END=700 /DNA_ORIENTATION=+